ncbi:MAG: hypothetical protein DMG10_04025 [Acidobacteria bacterium]|nr:MAG: hypothetical protein DMG10_04025 [Acidobacteriota bacterium]
MPRALHMRIMAVFIAAAVIAGWSQDWPQWRGSRRDGMLAEYSPPKTWPERLTQRWQVSVGEGHSSPVVVNRRIYLLTRQGEEEVVSCFDLDSGKTLWRDRYPVAYTVHPAAAWHGKGPKSTPLFHAARLYTLGIAGVLSCYEGETGRLRWRKEFASEYPHTSPHFGTAMSPVAEGRLVIAHVGGPDNGALTAFDMDTGEVKWAWKGDGPAYASPIVADLGGVRQIVTQSQKFLVGVSAANGELLWSIPFTTEYVQNIVTPVLYKEMLVFSGVNKGVLAIKVVGNGNKWTPEKVWETPEVSFYMNTPVVDGDLLLGLSHKNKGQFVCLDARTGKRQWASEGRQGENAAVVKGGDCFFLLTTDSELIVARMSGKGFEPIQRYTVANSPTWAHPVILNRGIVIKDAEKLTFWSWN